LTAEMGQAETDTQADQQTDSVCKGYLVIIPCVMPFLAAEIAINSSGKDRHTGSQTDSVWKGYLVMIPCVMPFLAAEMRKKRQL